MASNSGPICCAFCEQGHISSSCADTNARKEALRKSGRLPKEGPQLAKIVDPQDVATNVAEDITIPFAHARTRALATHQSCCQAR